MASSALLFDSFLTKRDFSPRDEFIIFLYCNTYSSAFMSMRYESIGFTPSFFIACLSVILGPAMCYRMMTFQLQYFRWQYGTYAMEFFSMSSSRYLLAFFVSNSKSNSYDDFQLYIFQGFHYAINDCMALLSHTFLDSAFLQLPEAVVFQQLNIPQVPLQLVLHLWLLYLHHDLPILLIYDSVMELVECADMDGGFIELHEHFLHFSTQIRRQNPLHFLVRKGLCLLLSLQFLKFISETSRQNRYVLQVIDYPCVHSLILNAQLSQACCCFLTCIIELKEGSNGFIGLSDLLVVAECGPEVQSSAIGVLGCTIETFYLIFEGVGEHMETNNGATCDLETPITQTPQQSKHPKQY